LYNNTAKQGRGGKKMKIMKVRKNFKYNNVEIFSIERRKNKLIVSADYNHYGKILSYSIEIEDKKYDLRYDKQLICIILRDEFMKKIYPNWES